MIIPTPGEIRNIKGKNYRAVPSGYTVRQYYSHETPEKGPGPGWDTRDSILEKFGVSEPSQLPDTPHFKWEEVSS